MDELSDEDKQTVNRARRIEKYLSQPFFVAEVFTNSPGKFVSIKDTVEVLKESWKESTMIFPSKHS